MDNHLELQSSLVKAFILRHENLLQDYDWSRDDLETLCEADPLVGYECITKIACACSMAVASSLGVGFLKPLLERSADRILQRLLGDVETSDPMRYALASAIEFHG